MDIEDWLGLVVVVLSMTVIFQQFFIHVQKVVIQDLKTPGETPHRLKIVMLGDEMAQGVEGDVLAFEVIALNKAGNPVPLKDPVSVAVADTAIASATVNPDGKNGQLKLLKAGDTTFTATSGQKTDTEPVSVKADTEVATIEVRFGAEPATA